MIPYFVYESIDLGFVKIKTWGLFLALGFLVSGWVASREFKRKGLAFDNLLDLTLVILICSLIGARVFYVLNEWALFKNHLIDIFKIWEGGLAFYGGLIGALIGGWVYIRIKKLSFLKIADAIFLVVPLGEAVARIGCFLIHDHLGRITKLPWGIEYFGTIRHETALYSIINGIVLFIVLWGVKKRKFAQREGIITAIFMIWYGFVSFWIYELRATDLAGADPRLWLFTISQYFSATLFLIGIIILAKIRKHPTHEPIS